jgi:hypothetical protein
MADADLDALADELYALPPDEFVQARAAVVAAAREGGRTALAAELGRLRKPTVTAWLANQVVRTAPDVVAGVIAVGPALREATVAGDAAALRDLGKHRAALLRDLVGRARTVAEEHERPFTATHQRELEATFTAAALDEDAAAALLTGRIVGPLEAAGLGFDLGGVPAQRPASPPRAEQPPASSAAGRRAAERAAEQAQAAEEERSRAVVDAEQELAEARLQDADAEAALAAAQDAFDAALTAEKEAADALRAAKEATSDARADLTAAKADATATGRAVAAALARLDKASRR